jgi:uncharacterized protein (TIGR02246 family)
LRRLALAVVGLALSSPAFADPAEQAVSSIIEKWSAGFTKLDADALASLYSRNALFFGSTPPLYKGKEGVAAYFNALPRWKSPTVQFTDLVTTPIGPDVINVAGTASFVVSENAPPVSFRLTWVIIREDGDWKIVSQMSRPRLPQRQSKGAGRDPNAALRPRPVGAPIEPVPPGEGDTHGPCAGGLPSA